MSEVIVVTDASAGLGRADAGDAYAAVRWAKRRLPRQTQPVPPIFQAAVGTGAVHHAGRHAALGRVTGHQR